MHDKREHGNGMPKLGRFHSQSTTPRGLSEKRTGNRFSMATGVFELPAASPRLINEEAYLRNGHAVPTSLSRAPCANADIANVLESVHVRAFKFSRQILTFPRSKGGYMPLKCYHVQNSDTRIFPYGSHIDTINREHGERHGFLKRKQP